MERLFVDTGAWFAYGNRGDPDHARVRKVLNNFAGRLVTTNFVVHETVTLCIFRRGHSDASRMGQTLFTAGVVDLVRITAEDEDAAWQLFLNRPDKTYSFTDCTSFIVMQRLGISKAAAVDDDFSQEGFQVLPPARRIRR